jgi:hypothetical protein
LTLLNIAQRNIEIVEISFALECLPFGCELLITSFFSSFFFALDDSCVKLWDLRKLKNFKTLQLEDGYEVRDLCFDSSGGNHLRHLWNLNLVKGDLSNPSVE